MKLPHGNSRPYHAGNGRILERLISTLIVSSAAGAAVVSIAWWLTSDPASQLTVRLPIPSNRGSYQGEGIDIRGRLAVLATIPVLPSKSSWPRFRGERFNNVAVDESLAEMWPETGPAVKWSVDLGEGHAGAAVRDGRVYVFDFDEAQLSDMLRVFSLEEGVELWRRWYRTGAKRNHGISRTVPAVSGRYVVTMGPKCHVMCVDAITGEYLWGIDLVRDFGTREPLWYTAQHPIIDDGMAIIAPAGKVFMMAVDCATGQVVWEAPNTMGWNMSHSSIVPMTVDGRKMYVYAALGGMAGVAADGPEAGTILWKTAGWNHSVVAPSPVPLGDGRLFVTAGYGVGSAIFEVRHSDSGYSVEEVRRFDRSVFACEQQTPVYYDGKLITVMPKDAGALRQQVVFMTPEGRKILSSGKETRFGLGPYMVADGKLLVLNDDGFLTMARARGNRWEELERAKVLEGRDAWAPMALAGGYLIVRDSRRMVCLDLTNPDGAGRVL